MEDPEITRQRRNVRGIAEAMFKTMAQRYSAEEAEEAYDEFGKSLEDQPELHWRYREYVTAEDVRRWLEEGEGESEEGPSQDG